MTYSSIESRLYRFREFGNEYEGSKCWLWTKYKNKDGYGKIKYESRMWYVHRLSYTVFIGPIPEGLVIDHLCRVSVCFNPKHLEAVTQADNVQRGESLTMILSRNQICSKGHSVTGDNAKETKNWNVECRTCINERARTRKETINAR